MRRHLAGLIALGALILAAVQWQWPFADLPGLAGASLRVGIVFTVVWIAYDQMQRLPGWILAVVPVLLLLLIIRPRWALYALPVILLLAILKPRRRRG